MSKKVNILIAEDEKIIALDIKSTLEKLGYNVTGIINNGEGILNKISEDNPDLILMDIMLKGDMTGIETAILVSQNFNIPIIYLTALTDRETLNKAKITEPFGYVLKPFDELTLHTSIEMALYKHKVESELKQRTKELEEEKVRTDTLLHNILPADIVKEWKEKGNIVPRNYNMISILFTDFHGFAELSSRMTPEILLKEMNEIFHKFDDIIEKHGLEKLKTIGESYMVGGGLPRESADHAVRVVRAAMEMHNYLRERNKTSEVQWHMRAGINSGQVIAGIVGANKFTYDVWGDTVNIASRMESSCEPGKINISSYTYELIKHEFECQYRGKLEAKGKGEVDMYFVVGQLSN